MIFQDQATKWDNYQNKFYEQYLVHNSKWNHSYQSVPHIDTKIRMENNAQEDRITALYRLIFSKSSYKISLEDRQDCNRRAQLNWYIGYTKNIRSDIICFILHIRWLLEQCREIFIWPNLEIPLGRKERYGVIAEKSIGGNLPKNHCQWRLISTKLTTHYSEDCW